MKRTVKMIIILLAFMMGMSGCGLKINNDETSTRQQENIDTSVSENDSEVNSENDSPSVSVKASYCYTDEQILEEVSCNLDSMMAADEETVYFVEVTNQYTADGDSLLTVYRLLAQKVGENEVTELYQCEEKNWTYGEKIISLAVCEDGSAAFLTRVKNQQGENYYLKRMDSPGALEEEVQLPETAEPLGLLTETKDGLAWSDYKAGIMLYERESHDWDSFGEDNANRYMGIGTLKNQTIWAQVRTGESPYAWDLMSWDAEQGDWIGIEIPFSQSTYNNVTSGWKCGYDFLLWNNASVAGWNVGETTVMPLVDMIASGIDFSKIRQLIALSETRYLARVDDTDGNGKVSLLMEGENTAIAEKIVLELAYLGEDSILTEVRRFNRENETAMIVLRDYSVYGEDKESHLKLDIGTGNAPDIFVTSAMSSVRDLITVGAFEDLYIWLEQDEELGKSDFLENILQAYEVDGSLYEMPLGFYLQLYAAKEKIVGNPENISFEMLQQLAEEYPESSVLSTFAWRPDFLREAIVSGAFYDLYSGECYFDSEQFIETLEFLNTLPAKYNVEGKDWPYTRTDEVLITGAMPNSFESFQWKEEYCYGEKTSFFTLGNLSNGLICGVGRRFAISSQSGHKAEAWEFLRYFWGEEYQNSVADSKSTPAFPVRISSLEYMKEKATNQESGSVQTYYWNGKEQTIAALTEEQIERYCEYIYRADTVYTLDYDIYNIVVEESEGYFAGQKSAEQVADVIQRRVQLYLWERQ